MAGNARKPNVVMDPAETTRVLVPVTRLDSFLTPTDAVFVVAHMGIARLDPSTWRLAVEGAVERPLVLALDDLTAMPARTVTSVHECYGNPVEPDVPTRRVANVRWTGVPLGDLLTQAGVKAPATHVWLEGADFGRFANVYSDRYLKDIPLDRALDGEVLVAFALNGEPLSHGHGFPVRAVVPGFFGTNSVKWLTRVYVADHRPESFFTTTLYNREVVVEGRRVRQPVRDLDVHSVIVRPGDGDALAAGPREITGWAWSACEVTRVEVSVTGGATWSDARLEPRAEGRAWQRFRFDWRAEAPGRHDIRCRAVDARGRVQPKSGRNRIHAIHVTVS